MNEHRLAQIRALLQRIGHSVAPERYRQIYCNRDLHLGGIQWIGFDMDYTLAIYHREAFDAVAHALTVERLIANFGYPKSIATIPFDAHFAIRGLVIDKVRGHIIKADSHRHVGKGYHGFRLLDDDERATYRRQQLRMSSDRYRLLDTLFEMPEAYLFAALVDHLENRGLTANYARLVDDIRHVIDTIHADGSLKQRVTADLPRYIERDPELAPALHRFRSAGKRLFLMTNSYWDYTEKVMSYLLNDANPSYPDWKSYFEVVVTGAGKPGFFRGHTPFYRLSAKGEIVDEEFRNFERGVVYQNGNLRDFERIIGLGADEILYIGDHIYGDILRSKRDSAWRTAMVIPEMEAELETVHT
ncbi:MAG: HAD-IG family 5'-nucleotidase, partial [Phycisphaerales bacterium]|nr:HAD-IG family 5'-nucleotidase [Phycisphaerales bacterium]